MVLTLTFLGGAGTVTGSKYLLDELLRWASGIRQPPRAAFVVHGEPQGATRCGTDWKKKCDGTVSCPTTANA